MSDTSVQDLFRRAAAEDDADAMCAGVECLMGLDGQGLSPEREHALRSPDFVMEMPQSGERVRGRDAMRRLQEEYPVKGGPAVTLRRVVGAGRTWVVEATSDYGDGRPVHVVVIMELDGDGLISRETRYYAEGFEAPAWRSELVEPID